MNEFLTKELDYNNKMHEVATGNIKAYFWKMVQLTTADIIAYAVHGE